MYVYYLAVNPKQTQLEIQSHNSQNDPVLESISHSRFYLIVFAIQSHSKTWHGTYMQSDVLFLPWLKCLKQHNLKWNQVEGLLKIIVLSLFIVEHNTIVVVNWQWSIKINVKEHSAAREQMQGTTVLFWQDIISLSCKAGLEGTARSGYFK